MLVYRDAARRVPAEVARSELCERVRRVAAAGEARELLALLILAGEVESAIADLALPSLAVAQSLTDQCADAVLDLRRIDASSCLACIDLLGEAQQLRLARPEGYAYYALDPRSYAALAADGVEPGRSYVVLGVRSIGTSLSAIVCRQLLARGAHAVRRTVRPAGEAWDRRLEFSRAERELMARAGDSEYWVVDEGPGLSGSTFLSVGEALERLGVGRDRIRFIGSHEVDAARLVAPSGPERWRRFRARSIAPLQLPSGAVDLGAGAWRAHVYASETEWPACWTQLERSKYLFGTPPSLFKFAGFGAYAEGPLQRARALADAGFSPEVYPGEPGFFRQEWLAGKPLNARRQRRRTLERLLAYLAFRSRLTAPERDLGPLNAMLRQNLAEACGVDTPLELQLEHPVYPDGRLQPHEWWGAADGRILKLDGIDHGDDHLLPGPCDSAWDMAGAIIEWQMSASEATHFIARYEAATRQRVSARLPAYLLAYTTFRFGCAQMAALACPTSEQARLERERRRYGAALERLLREHRPSAGSGISAPVTR